MAKSKHKRRKQQPRPVFYEALSAPTPPVGLPLVVDQMHDTLQTFGEVGQTLAQRARPLLAKFKANLLLAGLATAEAGLRSIRYSLLAGRYVADATTTYGPSIAADLATHAARTGRRLVGRRARILYLLAAIAGTIVLGALVAASAVSTIRLYTGDISSAAAILAKKKTGITITDRHGTTLFQGYGAGPAAPIALSEVPKAVKDATLASEDPDFYNHPGVSWRGTMRAIVTDITHQRKAEGGSTLTQQLVKNALLTSDKNFQRKYQEILLAMELERHYSKDEVLQMYLNQTYYGQGSTGVEAASRTYFHKAAKDLTLGESALLAGLPLGPSRFDPNVNLEAATGRRDYVLGRMLELGMIAPDAAKAAKAEPIYLAGKPGAPGTGLAVHARAVTIHAPHFVFYVLSQLREKYGDDMVENGGLKVQTTLDLGKQQLAERAVATRISELSGHHVTNGGLVSLEPKSGDILAMVGSVDYNAPGFGTFNVTLSKLQPGSSFKPFAYATAFKKGWNGATHVDDTPMSVPNGDGTMYVPQNYDLKFRGPVSLRQALANSLNIPALKVVQFAGINETIQTAHDLGVSADSLNEKSRYGISIVLGSANVRPLDMAAAYATFANNGSKVPPRTILGIKDRYDKPIAPPAQAAPQTVLDPRIAYMITNILSDNPARTPEFGPNSPLKLSRPAAAKTGTTNDFRDNWTVGYTPQLATAVWVGNNDHTPMNNVDGITGAAPIWHDYMEGALAGLPAENFAVPAGLTTAKVCARDGGLANPWDAGYDEIFLEGAAPTKPCQTFPQAAPAPTDPGTIELPDQPFDFPGFRSRRNNPIFEQFN